MSTVEDIREGSTDIYTAKRGNSDCFLRFRTYTDAWLLLRAHVLA